ncbi:Beta-(1--_2)glucan export ATP-binding/permease protein NdvA [Streptomyces sp. MBT84]|nr:Beta-(1-->2)glucan export ATP-binding/permease protein NdvA [Streptomyces sp. MBT84]
MSMETTAWQQLHSVMTAQRERRPFDRATLRRIGAFARPHRRRIAQFVVVSVVTALLAVATPVLAGRVVDAIVSHGDGGRVVRLSLLIAVIALAEAALGLLARRLSASLGRG